MLIGKYTDFDLYSALIPYLSEIRLYIDRSADIAATEWVVLNDRLKVIRLTDYNRDTTFMEVHRKYADLHYTIRGIDVIHAGLSLEHLQNVKEYDVERDFALYDGLEDLRINLQQQQWAWIPPGEPHRNSFNHRATEKFVFKISM